MPRGHPSPGRELTVQRTPRLRLRRRALGIRSWDHPRSPRSPSSSSVRTSEKGSRRGTSLGPTRPSVHSPNGDGLSSPRDEPWRPFEPVVLAAHGVVSTRFYASRYAATNRRTANAAARSITVSAGNYKFLLRSSHSHSAPRRQTRPGGSLGFLTRFVELFGCTERKPCLKLPT